MDITPSVIFWGRFTSNALYLSSYFLIWLNCLSYECIVLLEYNNVIFCSVFNCRSLFLCIMSHFSCFKRLLFSASLKVRFCYSVRLQHTAEIQNVDNSLPSNLVLLGISKEQRKKTDSSEILPPGNEVAIIRHCANKVPRNKRPIKVWLDSVLDETPAYANAVELHPNIFGVHPRMDILHEVVKWQKTYRLVDYAWSRTRSDMGRGKRKPWPQKGTGKKRQGSRVPPFWHKGAICHGPRGPRSLFYQLSDDVLINGLCIALTVKHIQNDLIVVDDVELPEDGEKCFSNFVENRDLAQNSMLFIHEETNYPNNLSEIVKDARTLSLMPLVGLNVYSILKHDKLVLPTTILDDLENKLIWAKTRYRWLGGPHNFYKDMPGTRALKEQIQNLTLES